MRWCSSRRFSVGNVTPYGRRTQSLHHSDWRSSFQDRSWRCGPAGRGIAFRLAVGRSDKVMKRCAVEIGPSRHATINERLAVDQRGPVCSPGFCCAPIDFIGLRGLEQEQRKSAPPACKSGECLIAIEVDGDSVLRDRRGHGDNRFRYASPPAFSGISRPHLHRKRPPLHAARLALLGSRA